MATNSKEYNKKNYRKYRGSPAEIQKRSNRNKARRKMGLKVGDPREVDHKDSNANNNSRSNLQTIHRTRNRRKGAMKANRSK